MRLTTLALWATLAASATACGSNDDSGLEGGGGGGKSGSGGATGGTSGASGATSGGAAGASGGAAGSTSGGGTAGTGAGGTGTGATGGGASGGTGGGGTGGSGAATSCGKPSGTCGNDGTSWPANAQAFECQLIDELNAKRKAGAKCGNTNAPPVAPLGRNQDLTNNARAHSEDMFNKSYVDVTTPDGVGPMDWSMKSYCGSYVTTDVGGGQANPSIFLATVMNVESECLKVMAKYAKGVGVGYYTDATGTSVHLWTLIVGNQ